MPAKSRTLILAAVVALLGVGLAGYYYVRFRPTETPTRSVSAKKPIPKSATAAAVAKEKDLPKGADTVEAANRSKSPLDSPTSATPLPEALEIPNLTGRPSGKLSPENDPRVKGGFRGEIFVRLDENADLKLQEGEIPEHYRVAMKSRDKDADGFINFDEFNNAIADLPDPSPMKTTVPASALLNPPEPGQEIPVYEPVITRRSSEAPLWFTNLDRSKDGHIAVYEWPTGRLSEFRALDANDDGFITLEEAKKAEAAKEASRQQSSESGPTSSRSPQSPFR